MGILKTGISAIGKLLTLVALAGAFLVGAVSVVYLSLRGEEVKVPEVVGKDFYASEGEIAALGLKLKKRATRYSEEKPNTVLEQLPKPGETVKTGQTISVVVSEANPEGSEAPATIKKNTTDEEDDSTDILQDQPTKSNKNSNTKKPSQTTRDVIKPNKNANSNSSTTANLATNSSSANSKTDTGAGGNKNGTTPPGNKSTTPNPVKPEPVKPNQVKPTAAKTPLTGGDTRTRKVQ